jgi:hypothetical protein
MKRIRQWRCSWHKEPRAVRREKAVTGWFAGIAAFMFLLCGGMLAAPLFILHQENQMVEAWMAKRAILLQPSAIGHTFAWAESAAGQKLEVIKDAKKVAAYLEYSVHTGDKVNSIASFDLTCESNGVRASAFCMEESVLIALDTDQKILWTESLKSSV